MPSERRVLAIPSTEDPTASANHRQKLQDDYLEKALKVVQSTMESVDEKVAWKAAQWVAEMVMGKPKQELEQTGGVEAEMARLLASAYAQHLQSQSALPPVIKDGVYILGGTLDDTNNPDTPEPNDRIIEMVEKRPRKTFDWDELPE